MTIPTKTAPDFASIAQERAFWKSHDSSDYMNWGDMDWGNAKSVQFANLKPSTKTNSLRLPESLLDSIKVEAHKRDATHQSLIKIWLSERCAPKPK